jgi:hypothetical protein
VPVMCCVGLRRKGALVADGELQRIMAHVDLDGNNTLDFQVCAEGAKLLRDETADGPEDEAITAAARAQTGGPWTCMLTSSIRQHCRLPDTVICGSLSVTSTLTHMCLCLPAGVPDCHSVPGQAAAT